VANHVRTRKDVFLIIRISKHFVAEVIQRYFGPLDSRRELIVSYNVH